MKLQGDDGWWMVGDDGGARKEELPTRTAEDRMGADRSRGGFCFLFFVFFWLDCGWLLGPSGLLGPCYRCYRKSRLRDDIVQAR